VRLSPLPQRSSSALITAPTATALSTLSLHDALPISVFAAWKDEKPAGFVADFLARNGSTFVDLAGAERLARYLAHAPARSTNVRSEEHTSELQSQSNLVCRLLLEKKKKKNNNH